MTASGKARSRRPTRSDGPPARVGREFRCADCGYGAISAAPPTRCPMCGGASWTERTGSGPTTLRRLS